MIERAPIAHAADFEYATAVSRYPISDSALWMHCYNL